MFFFFGISFSFFVVFPKKKKNRASFEELFGKNERRMERVLRGGSLGRSLSRSLGGGLYDHSDKPCVKEMQEFEDKFLSTEDSSRVSLRVSSLSAILYIMNNNFL